MDRIEIQVPSATRRTRLEDFLFDRFPDLSRMYLRDAVRDGRCEVNGRLENVGFRVRGGDFVEIEVDRSRETSMRPADIPLDIVFEDGDLIIVNKPAGMLVHPTHREKNGTLLNALAFYLNTELHENSPPYEGGVPAASAGGVVHSNCDSGLGNSNAQNSDAGIRNPKSAIPNQENHPPAKAVLLLRKEGSSHSAFRDPHTAFQDVPHSAFIRPGLVHRLDKQTSGLIVVAKSVAVHRKLARQFQRKRVEKKYLALVDGLVDREEGAIEERIGRYPDRKHWDVREDGKESMTRYRVRERNADSTLLELEPVTGRTNQLRIHCASIGHPIVGDVARGGREFSRLCLHSYRLALDHPAKGHRLEFEIGAPAEFFSTCASGKS